MQLRTDRNISSIFDVLAQSSHILKTAKRLAEAAKNNLAEIGQVPAVDGLHRFLQCGFIVQPKAVGVSHAVMDAPHAKLAGVRATVGQVEIQPVAANIGDDLTHATEPSFPSNNAMIVS